MTEYSFKLDEVWEEIQKRAEDLAQWNLSQPDLEWDEAHKLGMRWVDWRMRRDVHERSHKNLLRDIEELKKLLLAAKQYDKATGQPDCEQEDKIAVFKKLAELVGVNLDEVFAK